MSLFFNGLAAAFMSIAIPSVTFAGAVQVELPVIEHMLASLDIETSDGAAMTYTPADLEEFPTYRIETTTPWRDEAAVFDGVLLRDVLEAHDLAELPAVRLVAENDFSTTIERPVWESAPVLIATRVNGEPLTRRQRGPLLIVVPQEEFERHEFILERHLVWMISRIQPEG